MSDEQHDSRLDELLREAARDYNRPPATPRDRMWERIEAKRRAVGTRDSALGGVIPIRPRVQRQWIRLGVGIAAALALGFGLGRWNGSSSLGTPSRAAGTGATSEVATRTPPATPSTAGFDTTPDSAAATETASTPTTGGEPGTPREQRFARRAAPGSDRGTSDPDPATGMPSPESRVSSPAYTLAAIQHLTQAEALLTSFRADARGGKAADAQLSTWAKDLLVSTRLMLDSPAGRDPRMRRLLEDLELVLAQIAQLSGQHAGEELNLIDEAVEGRNVLPRLRTTIPAGARPVGS